jgi:hypothetical protein
VQVAANQLLLAPVVLAVVFSWNLALTGQLEGLGGKLQRDLVPSMMNGEGGGEGGGGGRVGRGWGGAGWWEGGRGERVARGWGGAGWWEGGGTVGGVARGWRRGRGQHSKEGGA